MPSAVHVPESHSSSATTMKIDSVPVWQTRRSILGMSAILLPFEENGSIDWTGFRSHVQRTLDAGLIPAVNMDTGYANLIDEATRVEVLRQHRRSQAAACLWLVLSLVTNRALRSRAMRTCSRLNPFATTADASHLSIVRFDQFARRRTVQGLHRDRSTYRQVHRL